MSAGRAPSRSRAWRRFKRNPAAVVGAVLVALVVGTALLAPLLAPHDPVHPDVLGATSEYGEPLPPSASHPLGTDPLGRCVASRVIYGARVSLLVGVLATLIATLIGTAAGVIAGFRGGWVDALFMRLADLVLSFPFLLLVIALAAVLRDAGLAAVLVVLGVVAWTNVARVVRARVLTLRELDYVAAARAAGASTGRILVAHVLPNVAGPVIVMATVTVAQLILAESTLAYLGFGAPPPTATWGRMLQEGQQYLTGGAPWISLAPGFAVLVTALGFNLLGDGLRDALDPREAGR